MIRIGHAVDATFAWDQRVALAQLLDRLPSDRYVQHVCTLDEGASELAAAVGAPVESLRCFRGWGASKAPSVRRFVQRHHLDILHVWGPEAAVAGVPSGCPVVLDLHDPVRAARNVKRLRSLSESGRFAACCRAQIVRRRLVEGGVPLESTAVVRPGVDFGVVNKARRPAAREAIGADRDDFLIVTPERMCRGDGHLDACLVACMLNRTGNRMRIVLPGDAREQRRLARQIQSVPAPPTLLSPPAGTPTERLIAMADALIVVPRGDIATTAVAWAMASETLVIGTATYAVAELIATRVNGLLFKQTPGRRMVTDIAPLLRGDRSVHAKLKEAARGQAYEVFGLRRCVEQTMQVYDNLLAGKAVDCNINDPAMAG